ncbi:MULTISPECIES: bifunctional hydroxymethylpyrimidine kinase/phosphomethylpyrimidine kinase [Staphylococcus]|uniref:Hydroxymethylpyrimidine/phosphomethylpyrimidine kinase n=1 Tax=Staphylococcus agnetis TaxID=985762 RepID=A0A2T4MF86_9STAP|nr:MULTISPECIES: bifunctional hydroxymethylpyrimidine kinase/phosphomethylpyrimidine kinase [Staphylococcus]NHM91155.1 bifunctional hydroxymethylpyrimidine kinase/phosphomethylpyrimidine kinase [Staphylococcus sp. 10602379]NJI02349.1 bifunctional hydroxymethylpyrimidine kinase/phosphomethylpyrimidine kinase [Staphylococcus agnetis]NJI12266.1 bifunctional hydroxymethylpyrimidine kinase/phosphomethylpyrimidine kinase [Staphylococcus agnetis]PTH13441.1 bifunctional hydroxymethylpyrimidine kinase/p
MNKLNIALTIAGTDPSGGAGVMADLKSFHACGVYGMAAITSIVAQNSLGVQHIHNLDTSWLEEQLESIFMDAPPHAMKTGMIPTPEMMALIASYVKKSTIPYVIDPVMVAKSGDALMSEQVRRDLKSTLLPLADVATPNIPEAEEITQMTLDTETALFKAGQFFIKDIGAKGVVLKGGHLKGNATDYLVTKDGVTQFTSERFPTRHTHGTGCTFSAVITAELAKGNSIIDAVAKAKNFISKAIQYTPEIGKGRGPVNHFAYQREKGWD